jgi:hypothetical protein
MYNYLLLIFTIILFILFVNGALEYIDICNKREGIGKIGRSIRRVTRRATRTVSRGARNVGRRIGRTARNVGRRIGGAFSGVAGLSSGLINSVKRAVKTVDRLPGQINSGVGKVNSAFRQIGKLGTEIESLGREVGGFGRQVGSEIGGVWDKVKDFTEKEFKRVEGVSKSIAGKVEGKAKSLAGEISDIAYDIGEVVEDIPGEVEGLSKSIFLDKIPRFFKQVWAWIKRNIIDPMVGFFISIGDIFEDIGNIFIEIFYFLLRIPGCIPVYMFDATKSIVWNVYLTVFPKWIKNINRWIHINITIPFIYPLFGGIVYIWQILLELFGFRFKLNLNTSKCYETGIIGKIIGEIIDFMKLIFNGIGDLFRMIDINSIINQIVGIF